MRERVAVVRCRAEAGDWVIQRAAQRAVEMVEGLEDALRGARRVAVKINAGVDRIVLTAGRQTELTDPAVVEGVVRALREVTDAELLIGDAPTDETAPGLYERLGLPQRLAFYPRVRLMDFGRPPFVPVPTPPGALMFREYQLNADLASADAFVSIAKMKAHRALGCTLCIKNLFGWTPPRVYGHPRQYLHDRLIRLPRVLADLALLFRPVLNVVDGIVAANFGEWHGEPVQPGVILAGRNAVAVDAVGMRIMGFDPRADYPDPPFYYRHNAVLLAHRAGMGPIRSSEIEVLGEGISGYSPRFRVEPYGPGPEAREEELRRGAEAALAYAGQRERHLERHAGRYVAFRGERPVWSARTMDEMIRLERTWCHTPADYPDFVVRVLPAEEEIECLQAYAEPLRANRPLSYAAV